MTLLLSIAVALFAGLLVSRLIKPLKLPAVTAYLVAGILIGPFCLGRLGIAGLGFQSDNVASLDLLSNLALGFIAFEIGNEFRLGQLKKNGKQATVIGIFQAVLASIFVDIALVILHFIFPDKMTMPIALTLGAIASATAPAATLMVVRQYKAKGPVTDILLPIVALDDAVGLVVFAVSFGIAKAIKSGKVDAVSIIVEPLIEIAASLLLGALTGYLISFAEKHFKSNSKRLSLNVTFVTLTVALSMMPAYYGWHIGEVDLSFSSLLVCMMMGTIFCNCCDFSAEMMSKTSKWTAPLYILFFVISGAELDFSVFSDAIVIVFGLVFILVRSAGKYIGANVSSRFTHCEENIVKYLGITLLPQAGVALGMCLSAQELGGSDAQIIRNVVLFAVLVYELIGPYLTKVALTKAGEITPKDASDNKKSDDLDEDEE